MTAMSNLKFSRRSDLLIIALKISLTGLLLVGGIYLLERFMMDIENSKILWDLGLVLLNCSVISGVLLLGLLPIIENLAPSYRFNPSSVEIHMIPSLS